jgi:hypothetical protein
MECIDILMLNVTGMSVCVVALIALVIVNIVRK